jgi:tetratricopeptide (TPR) repeat protein
MVKDTEKGLLYHLKSRLWEIARREDVSIQGDGNVIGDNNTVTVIKQRWSQVSPFLLPISIVILLGVITVLFFQYRQFRHPTQMEGEFNVAVAEFTVVGEQNNRVQDKEAKALSEFLAQRLETYLAEIDAKMIDYELWSPSYTGQVKGRTREERARSAASLVQRINAHIIVYGVISQEGNHSQFSPEFYVSYEGFEEGQEIIGQHRLGDELLIPSPFDKTQLQAIENPALAARVKALSLVTVGLAYYSIDEFESALEYFEQAKATEGWLDSAGKEVACLLTGNSYVRLASRKNQTEYLPLAKSGYTKALELAPTYARAKLGLSGVLYLEAVGDPNNPSFETVDLDGLSAAEAILHEILATEGLPESVNFETKADLRLGHIYLVRAQLLGGDWLKRSKSRFKKVIREYESGNAQVAGLASHAHAKLGLINLLEDKSEAAIEQYKQAINLATPHYQAHYYSVLGEIYMSMSKTDLALDAYEQAIQIAEFYGDEENATKYTQRLLEIQEDL